MKTELICVGTELLTGKLNTNCAYIGEKLSLVGLDLSFVTAVGDDPADMEQVFRQATGRSRVVIVTGGLGPTFDDLTREAAAKVLDRKLVLDREALAAIAARFAKRGMAMPKNNERQAYVIEGARLLPNRNGTAPGQIIEYGNGQQGHSLLILLPGPPREMQVMFEESVFPLLKKHETKIKKMLTVHVAGEAESLVDEKIRPIIEAERKLDAGFVSFTILAHQMIIDVKTSVSGEDEMLVDETMQNIRHELYAVLGNNIFGEDKDTLEGVVGRLLTKAHRTLSVAESCTGGLIAHRITNVAGSSLYFREGAVTYANEAKVKRLGVHPETLAAHGAVSEETALEMAKGMAAAAGTDFALSVTGIAGPSGGTPEKPVGLVYIGLSGPSVHAAFRFQFTGSRTEVRERAANQALDILRRQLTEGGKKK